MGTTAWIVVASAAMAGLALSGSATLLLPADRFDRVVPPLVGLAAGSLLGGALFHLLPESVHLLGNDLGLYGWLTGGIVTFFALEQYLQWHHCHRSTAAHRPLGHLVLVADALHNVIDGLALGTAFVTSTELGVVTWVVLAAHEVPQELGDFGILVHSGWGRQAALVYNVVSGSTVVVGALVAEALAGRVDVAVLLPFAAGNFLYLSLSDLLPTITVERGARTLLRSGSFAVGLGALAVTAMLAGHPG